MHRTSRTLRSPFLRRLTSIVTIASALVATTPAVAEPDRTGPPHLAGRGAPLVPVQRTAPSEVAGEVLVILASETPGEIDPALSSMQALRQPPFNAFHSMQLLARPSIRMTVGQPQNVPLPNGRVLQLVLESVTPEGRYRVRVSINRPEQQDYLPLLEIVAPPGDPFFLAGQNFMGGTLVLGVRLGERAPR